ncbi:MAG TPA: DUF3014 domain-containing protein [Anaeromyxobacteraceae bacterium]|nr:DUF3014 domain-containing protein [Anaeromyxobacteraceae bacterium]
MPEPEDRARSLRRNDWVAFALAAVVVAGAAAYWWMRRTPEQPPPAQPSALAAPETPAVVEAPPAPVGPDRTRALLEAISPDAAVRRALADGDVVRRWVVVTDNLAEGASPRKELSFLGPSQPFSTIRQGARAVIAPASYARYDGFADLVSRVDARAVAAAYRALHGVAEAAYRALGYPKASLDQVTARALRRVERAPVPEGDVEVQRDGGVWTFADPKLEMATAVEKHLVRMGARNERLVQAKAREIEELLGLPASAEAASQKR